jgi:hypothetical protein
MLDLTPIPATAALAPAPAAPVLSFTDPDAQADREDAFSADPEWNGQPLQAFSVERYSVFVSQRVSIGAPSLYQALRDGNAFYPDALRILWLCSQPPAVIQSLRRDPEAMQAAIEAWAATHAPVHLAATATTTALRIFNDAQLNRHESRHSNAPAARTGTSSGN